MTAARRVDEGEGRIPRSCAHCIAGWTENWCGKPVRCEDCTRPDCDDGRETLRHLPAQCAVCDDSLTFGHAFEVQDADGDYVLICEDLECSRELRRLAHTPAPAALAAFADWTGPNCSRCGFPALLHGERCEEVA